MNLLKKSISIIKPNFSNSSKKNFVDLWRYFFTAQEKGTGVERSFFIELEFLNPGLNPSSVVLGFDSRVQASPEQLQNVLAGTVSAKQFKSENLVVPSYVSVKIGFLGKGAKQLCSYYPLNDVKISSKTFEIEVGKCVFTENRLIGLICQNSSDVQEHPGSFSDTGMISWDLRYEIKNQKDSGYSSKDFNWIPIGNSTVFAGQIVVDGREYSVFPKKSFGFFDRFYGGIVPTDLFHISSSHLTSLISGKLLENSSFSVHGIFKNRLSVLLNYEGMETDFCANASSRSYNSISDCSTTVDSENEDKLHWSLSVHNKKIVIDIDAYSVSNNLFVRTFELPEGFRKVIKQVSGVSFSGEIRIYKKDKKNLELLEHAQFLNALCEFGSLELPEN